MSEVLGNGGGLRGLVSTAAELTGMATYLLDPNGRLVTRSVAGSASRLPVPDLAVLLAGRSSSDGDAIAKVELIGALPGSGLVRRHLLASVLRNRAVFGWLVVAEVPGRFNSIHHVLVERTAFHLGTEYSIQRKVARVSWNAKSTLARQMVRGSAREEDLRASAEYLGIRADADRVLVFILDAAGEGSGCDDVQMSERLSRDLGVEVLGTRGIEGAILLVEAPATEAPLTMVERVRAVMTTFIHEARAASTVVGISAVTKSSALHRAYRETREVVRVADRFAPQGGQVIAVDDLGPARLFVANGDLKAVRRYAEEVLGPLTNGSSASAALLGTLQGFFDCGRSVRESAVQLGIHENTVRLRLSKIRSLIGLDVAGDAHAQLSVQTALLVLRLEGHPAVAPRHRESD
jgi:sugar diacid utilization regulator